MAKPNQLGSHFAKRKSTATLTRMMFISFVTALIWKPPTDHLLSFAAAGNPNLCARLASFALSYTNGTKAFVKKNLDFSSAQIFIYFKLQQKKSVRIHKILVSTHQSTCFMYEGRGKDIKKI